MAFRAAATKLMLGKIGIVGGGNIGGVLAQECAKRNLAKTIGLMDIAVCVCVCARARVCVCVCVCACVCVLFHW